jgi:hypothetical protein
LVLLVSTRKIVADKTLALLSLFAVSFAVFSVISGYNSILVGFKMIIFPCSYYLGSNFQFEKNERDFKEIIVDIAAFMALHLIVNFFYNLRTMGLDLFAHNVFKDAFSGEISAATGQIAYAFVFCSIVGYLLFMNHSFWKKIIYILMFFVMLIYNIALGGRTFFLLSFLSIVIGVFVYIKNKKMSMVSVKILIGVGMLIGLLFLIYTMDVFGVKSTVQQSYFYERFFAETDYSVGVFSDSRLSIKGEYLKHLLDYPFGGGAISDKVGYYAHELWLDTYDAAGIIPFVLIIVYSIASAVGIFKFSRREDVNSEERMLLISFLVTMVVSFFLEPIISGAPMVLAAYCFINGVITSKARNVVG